MKSAGFKLYGVTDKDVDRMIQLMDQGKKPMEVKEELKLDWALFNECLQRAAIKLRGITYEGLPTVPPLWRDYTPVDLRQGLAPPPTENEKKAMAAFEKERKNRFSVPGHPDVKYIPTDRLTDQERDILGLGESGDGPILSYTAPADHDGLTRGHTYFFTIEGAEKLDLFDPAVMAGRIFFAKGPVGSHTQMAIRDSDLSAGEARDLRSGGYVAVHAPQDMGLGASGYKIKLGDICWMRREEAEGLEDVSEQAMAGRYERAERDQKLAEDAAARKSSMKKAGK